MTGRAHAAHYARWGFVPVLPAEVPWLVRGNYYLGQLIGGAHAFLTWREVNRLVPLRRDAFALALPGLLSLATGQEREARETS